MTIKMTPQELRDAASYINKKRTAILSEVKQLESKINQVTSGWEGASQSQFTDTFAPMLKKDFPSVIEGIEGQLKGAADAIESADKQVADAFKVSK